MNPDIVKSRAKELLERFNCLHSALDGLPECSRRPLRKLVAQGTRECENLGTIVRELEDSLADLYLSTAHARFEMNATLQDLRNIHHTFGPDR